MELTDTTAVINGSTGSLGRAVTLALAKAGVDCICHFHKNRQAADDLTAQIKALGPNAIPVAADLTVPEQIDNLFTATENLAPPTILINSAAVFSRLPLTDITLENAQQVLNINLIAPVLVSRKFAQVVNKHFPHAETPIAKIINLSDIGALRPWANYTIYCAS